MERKEFSRPTKQAALTRQENRCGSCGEIITSLDQAGKKSHKYGEGAHAHHMVHCKQGGTNMVSNCVILCESCHFSTHHGGNYKNKENYLRTSSSDYKFFYGKK